MTREAENRLVGAIERSLLRVGVRPASSLLIGLSGGADSVALTCALLDLRERSGLKIAAAHLNHRIRANESDRDEDFVRAMCARLGIDLVVERAEGLASAANLEERAREARLAFLGRAADCTGGDYVVLGHHRDDQAETVLMRLMRGAGAAGMAAMSERGPGRLLRPMLSISRSEIRDYLAVGSIPFVEDSTNSSPDFLRNRIRAELIPMLERDYAPGLSGRLVELAGEMRSLDELVGSIAARELDAKRTLAGALDVSGFDALNPAVQTVALRLFLSERMGSLRRVSRAHVEDLLHLVIDGGPSDSIDLPGGWRAEREYQLLRLVDSSAQPGEFAPPRFSVAIAPDGITIVEDAGFKFAASTVSASQASMPESLSVAVFDAAKVAGAGLIARNYIRGDRMRPIGMRGTRKLHDVFVDRKLPRARRERFPVVTVGDVIVWIPGFARAQYASVTKVTEIVLRVEASEITA